MKKHWQAIAGAAVGAAVVVTVYEGKVLFAGKDGEEHAVAAGQVLTAEAGGAAVVRDGSGGPEVAGAAAALLSPPGEGATREELLARDAAQRAEIARLRASAAPADGPVVVRGNRRPDALDASGRPWFNPSKANLTRFAAECRVRYDLPPVFEDEPYEFGPRTSAEIGLSDAERAGLNKVMASLHQEMFAQLRVLYIEVTGDAAKADDLSPQALASELNSKSPRGEAARINRLIAQERAGLAQPPANLAQLSPIERFMRLQAGMGDETERRIGEVVGPDRARQMREMNGGWGHRREIAGCPGGGDGGEEVEVGD